MLRHSVEYKETGQACYDEKYRKQMIKNLKRKAAEFGLSLIESK